MGDAFRFDLIPPGCGVLCALSGGADSMYLLCRLLEGRERYGWTVYAAHFNHGLRPAAARDEDFVRDWCGRQGVPLTTGLIATGHHAGGNAETVLMNLIRGTGLRGLAGIPERRDNIVRPMLGVSRAEVEAYLEKHGVPHVEDETNAALDYTRNRVRSQLLPLLEELNPRASAHIAAAARRLAEDEEELSRQAGLLSGQGLDIPEGAAIPARVLREAPRPIALRACARLLNQAGLGGGAAHLDGMLAQIGRASCRERV